jgi:apolipoprotein N-acyltransferase
MIQSANLVIESYSGPEQPGWIEQFGLFEKLPWAFVFGGVLALASPGFDLWWIAWIGLVPLLVLLRAARSKTDAALMGLAFGLGYNLVSLSWYLGLFPLRWLGLQDWVGVQAAGLIWLVESLHQSVLFVGFALLVYCLPVRAGFLPYQKRPYFPYLISVPIIWVFFLWVIGQSEVFFGIPVNELAYSQARQLEVIQLAKLAGSGSIDFLLVMSNAVIASLVIELFSLATRFTERADRFSSRAGAWLDFSCLVALIVLIFCWGRGELLGTTLDTDVTIASAINPQAPPVPVALLQGNVTIEEDRWHTSAPSEIARRYDVLSKNLGTSMIVLPEGVINSEQIAPGFLLSNLKDVMHRERKEILMGTTEAVNADGYENALVNAARLIGPFPFQNNIYVKRKLVPFGEAVPISIVNQRIPEEIKKRLPGTSHNFIAGHSLNLIKSAWGKVGVSICSEVIYPHLISSEVRRGSSLLINLSNLGWFHNSFLNRQVLAAAVLRAVENGRFMILSTNTGISAIIDPAGVVTSASYAGKRGVLLDTVQFLYGNTPFSRMWWL